MADKLRIKPLNDNECAHFSCAQDTTPEGLLCSRHWKTVPDVLKGNYQWSKKQILMAVKAFEEIKKDLR